MYRNYCTAFEPRIICIVHQKCAGGALRISAYNSAVAKTFKSTNMKQWLSKTKHLQSIEMSSVLFLF